MTMPNLETLRRDYNETGRGLDELLEAEDAERAQAYDDYYENQIDQGD